MTVRVVDDPAAAAADRLAGVAERGGHIALAGGSTPRAAYERAAAAGRDWSAATLWFGDERCVPPEHEHANYRMVKESLLDRLGDHAPSVHRIPGERGAEDAAHAYEAELRRAFGDVVPRLDLVLLGLGPDGHTASLFPGDSLLEEGMRLVAPVPEAGLAPFVPRVTLTLPVLNAAHEILFLVSGAEKAEAVARVFAPEPDPSLPASLVRPFDGELTVLLDPRAAADLEHGGDAA